MAKVGAMATGVLYDFSIVTKAKFYVYEFHGDFAPMTPHPKYPCLPVQINPSDLSITHGGNTKTVDGISPNLRDFKAKEDSASITLVYDIYDLYNVATQDGALDVGMVSLENRNATSLMVLRDDIADHSEYRVIFSWGPVKIFGLLESFTCSFEAFSRWGVPLKAKATANIKYQMMYKSAAPSQRTFNIEESAIFAPMSLGIRALETAERVANQALLAASQATR